MKLYVFLSVQIAVCSISSAQNAKQRNVLNNLYSIMFAYNQFESKYNTDLVYLNKLGDLLNNYRFQLQAVLDAQVFNKRESETRTDLQNLFINNHEVFCTASFNDGVNDARSLGLAELHYCASEVREDFNAFKNNFTYSRDKLYLEKWRTDELLRDCDYEYNHYYDLVKYNQCIQTVKDSFVSLVKEYKINVHTGADIKDKVVRMGRCADAALRVIGNILNKNYNDISDCLAGSVNPVTQNVIIPAINAMSINLSTVQVEKEIKRAVDGLLTDADRSLESAADIKAFLQNGDNLLLSYGYLEKHFRLLDDINQYRIRFQKSERVLTTNDKGIRDCIVTWSNELVRTINQKKQTVLLCTATANPNSPLNTLTNTIDLQLNLKTRDLNEGLISVINCFSDSKIALKPETAACCVIGGDQSYRKYAAQIEDQAEVYRQRFSGLSDDYFVCEERTLPEVITIQQEHKKSFEACVSKVVNYTYYMEA